MESDYKQLIQSTIANMSKKEKEQFLDAMLELEMKDTVDPVYLMLLKAFDSSSKLGIIAGVVHKMHSDMERVIDTTNEISESLAFLSKSDEMEKRISDTMKSVVEKFTADSIHVYIEDMEVLLSKKIMPDINARIDRLESLAAEISKKLDEVKKIEGRTISMQEELKGGLKTTVEKAIGKYFESNTVHKNSKKDKKQ